MLIRQAEKSDFEEMWSIFQAVVASGESYVFSPEATQDDAWEYWFGRGVTSYVAEIDGQIAGMYKLIANQRDLGSHVANASFMVSPAVHGLGVGKALGRHCLDEARKAGFRAMQFNYVVNTNTVAVELWKKLGFRIVGTLPGAFSHRKLGYVDVHVMYRFLDETMQRTWNCS